MRTGAEYREALRDGRVVYVMGEGRVDDVTTHPATRAVVEEQPSPGTTGTATRPGPRRC